MNFLLAVYCLCAVTVFVVASPPLVQIGDPSVPLSDNCQIPKCPDLKSPEDKTVTVLPYPLDCLQYVLCRGSESRIVACPPDTVFDKTAGACAPQATTKCVPCYQQAP